MMKEILFLYERGREMAARGFRHVSEVEMPRLFAFCNRVLTEIFEATESAQLPSVK